MIEIKSVRELGEERKVEVPYSELKELLDNSYKALELYSKLKVFVLEQYVQNYACFGNGGTITYKELAEMLSIELPVVHHVGVSEYLKIKRKVDEESERENS